MYGNSVNTLFVGIINPDYFGHKAFAMFHVIEQNGADLKVHPVWYKGCTNTFNVSWTMNVNDVWFFVTSLSDKQEAAFKQMGLVYRFHEDDKALERLAGKLDMDRMFIGYEGESEEGTWFNCCRTDNDILEALREYSPNFHVYSLRASDDDDSQAASIEEKVLVNHYGDILTDRPLSVPVMLEVDDVEYDEEGNIIG